MGLFLSFADRNCGYYCYLLLLAIIDILLSTADSNYGYCFLLLIAIIDIVTIYR